MRKIVASIGTCALLSGCAGRAPVQQRPMGLQRVVLYQNGIGYFERAGHIGGDTLQLQFSRAELDDVLKTLTVIDRLGAAVATVDVPTMKDSDNTIGVGVRMSAGRVHDLRVSYAVPTPTWKAAYRVVLDEHAKQDSLLQGWAMVNNVSQENWNNVQLTLATGAPMSLQLDLHTPEFARRPDIHGNLVAPVFTGAVENETVGAADSDGDGILDVDDLCPEQAEDKDAVEDEDGCPDNDNDHDRIADAFDKCPNEPETYNGFEDDDGCPDRGRVVVTSSAIDVLDEIFFPRDSATLLPVAQPILDAIAATMRGNPEIAKVEIGGHTSNDEGDAWGLASRRAAAVRAALTQRGVEGSRLVTVPYGSTRPLAAKDDEPSRQKNRRADFYIAARSEVAYSSPVRSVSPSRPAPPVYDARTAQASVHTSSKPADVAGSVRYVLSEPVTIRRGSSTMVSILNKPIAAEDAYLFRPDGNAAGSDRHPFRAVRLSNDSGFTLEPGPIAIFARGTFVGDSLLGRLDVGETAWIPYAVEGSTTVTMTTDETERPTKIASISRGVMTVESADIRTTRYTIAAGREPAKRIYIRHTRTPGYATKDLPPGTIDQGASYLVPLPLQPGKTSVLAVEEREPRRRTLQLLDQGLTQLGLYIEGTKLPPGIAEKLRTAVALRKEMGALDDDVETARTKLGDLAQRADEIRESLRAVERVRGADALKKKLLASLTQATASSDAAARELEAKTEAIHAAREKLQDALREITLEDTP